MRDLDVLHDVSLQAQLKAVELREQVRRQHADLKALQAQLLTLRTTRDRVLKKALPLLKSKA